MEEQMMGNLATEEVQSFSECSIVAYVNKYMDQCENVPKYTGNEGKKELFFLCWAALSFMVRRCRRTAAAAGRAPPL